MSARIAACSFCEINSTSNISWSGRTDRCWRQPFARHELLACSSSFHDSSLITSLATADHPLDFVGEFGDHAEAAQHLDVRHAVPREQVENLLVDLLGLVLRLRPTAGLV